MKHRRIIISEVQRENAIKDLQQIPLEPQHECLIQPHKEDKTLAQLKTVHMWIRESQTAFAERGRAYTVDALKYHFKELFGKVEVLDTPSGIVEQFKSFRDYTKEEMTEFMDKLYHYLVCDLEIYVTLPGFEEEL